MAGADLVERASCVREDLTGAIHRPARLGVLSGSEVKYVEKRPNCPVTSFDVDATLPAHATALGKVLLAFSPTRITDGLLAQGLTQFTRYTIVAPEKFRHNLATIRQVHVAVSSGELEIGNHGVAMPVFADGKVLAAIEVQVGDPQNDLARVSPALAVACGGLSRELSAVTRGRTTVDQLAAVHPLQHGSVQPRARAASTR
jgi:DNA-binding IclR family transcriptional regulator